FITVSSATRAPVTRPVFARTSSAASGLRFCGMIEEPVVKASDSRMKRYGALDPKRPRGHLPIDRKRGPGQGRRSQRAGVQPSPTIGQPAAVAVQHLDIG